MLSHIERSFRLKKIFVAHFARSSVKERIKEKSSGLSYSTLGVTTIFVKEKTFYESSCWQLNLCALPSNAALRLSSSPESMHVTLMVEGWTFSSLQEKKANILEMI